MRKLLLAKPASIRFHSEALVAPEWKRRLAVTDLPEMSQVIPNSSADRQRSSLFARMNSDAMPFLPILLRIKSGRNVKRTRGARVMGVGKDLTPTPLRPEDSDPPGPLLRV
jgi:hypothetical protein